jgi:hypothetical protein
MRRIHLSLFVFCSATAAYADTPFMGQCHMDACGWIRIREKNLLKQKGDARLFEVKSDYGESFHKNGSHGATTGKIISFATIGFPSFSTERKPTFWISQTSRVRLKRLQTNI